MCVYFYNYVRDKVILIHTYSLHTNNANISTCMCRACVQLNNFCAPNDWKSVLRLLSPMPKYVCCSVLTPTTIAFYNNWYAHIANVIHHYSSGLPSFTHPLSQAMIILRGVGNVKQHSLSNPITCSPGGGPSPVLVADLLISITILRG